MNSALLDNRAGYGLVSRFFHWFMALLVLWQATSAALHFLADETAAADFFFAYHKTIGFSLLVLTLLRGAWGLANLARRPPHTSPVDRLAVLGHLAIYVLLIAVPTIALIREYGSGEGYSAFGMPLFPTFQPEIEWMTGLGSALHGELGWVLLALIVGHIAMAFVHEHVWKERRIARMTVGRT